MPRRLGQHFLVRKSILERIALAALPEPGGAVVEIGPGRGALTSELAERAERVIAVEIDPVLVQYLRAKFRGQRNVEIVASDVLKLDLNQWGRTAVAGNLPYYITSPIIEKVLDTGPLWTRATFLVQKEVAERITAKPGSRDYGFLTVRVQFYSEAELLFTVPPSAFRPPPLVDSAVIRLTPKPRAADFPESDFVKFAGLCFHLKRKTIRNNLLGSYDKAALDAIPETGRRAEQMPIPELMELYAKLKPARL